MVELIGHPSFHEVARIGGNTSDKATTWGVVAPMRQTQLAAPGVLLTQKCGDVINTQQAR